MDLHGPGSLNGPIHQDGNHPCWYMWYTWLSAKVSYLQYQVTKWSFLLWHYCFLVLQSAAQMNADETLFKLGLEDDMVIPTSTQKLWMKSDCR